MKQFGRRQVLALGSMSMLTACSLPRGAAREKEIYKSAEKDPVSGFAIYQVTRSFIPQLETWPATGNGPRGGWIARQPGARSQVIAPGDTVSLIIWDSEDNSLLTSPEQKSVKMEQLVVSPNGDIFVPYVGKVGISGFSREAAREKIQDELTAIVPSAQVQLTIESGRSSSVDLVGGVAAPGNYPLVDRDMTVLNLISQAGGVASGLQNPIIRLVRGGKLYVTSISRLYDTPGLDTTLRGGDKVIVEDDPRHFLALGAAGKEQRVQFPKDNLTALDAIALIGGVSDSRADPKGILVLREYPLSATRAGTSGPREPLVIFGMDITTADGLFAARNFEVMPDDVVYASESPITTFDTITGLAGQVFGLTSRVSRL